MSNAIHTFMAREHVGDLRRDAQRGRRPARSAETEAPAVELRMVRTDESAVVRRLAALDEAPELEGPILMALVDGEAVAALALRDGRVVANPFVSTLDAVALLRLRADHVAGPRMPRRRIARILAPRAA